MGVREMIWERGRDSDFNVLLFEGERVNGVSADYMVSWPHNGQYGLALLCLCRKGGV